ncbi:hypothetical protein K2173_019065 [Erythroxylum novogranatense]|uniref:Polygalacturonase n=1 Tax=Erythroxylum novogranatense TaxID=1862640 RepID=A0AAV8SSL7_9ROSI|nr:hypothetical protein K2173_019065 [Erythroxylum novogranatense]
MVSKAVVNCFRILFFAATLQASNAVSNYNVVDFGAHGDGKTDSTRPFLRAWLAACRSREPASVEVPAGSFLVGTIVFNGPCKNEILFQIDGTIVAPSDYWKVGKYGYWILFSKVKLVTISGGTIDANGANFWACRESGRVCPPGARSISFERCNNVKVSNLTSMDSQLFHISVYQSHDLAFENIKAIAPNSSLNTDGIHMQSVTGITVKGGTIMTGDDCISMGPGTKNVRIEHIACGPGHGISVGSLAEQANEDGVQNMTVTDAIFTGTQNGVRIKSWARPCTGFVKNIVFRNVAMRNAQNPIIIDQNYCPDDHDCPHQNSGVKISGVTYKNIKGTSASDIAINFNCSASNPCVGLELVDIDLTYLNPPNVETNSTCNHANGSSSGVVIPQSCF